MTLNIGALIYWLLAAHLPCKIKNICSRIKAERFSLLPVKCPLYSQLTDLSYHKHHLVVTSHMWGWSTGDPVPQIQQQVLVLRGKQHHVLEDVQPNVLVVSPQFKRQLTEARRNASGNK